MPQYEIECSYPVRDIVHVFAVNEAAAEDEALKILQADWEVDPTDVYIENVKEVINTNA